MRGAKERCVDDDGPERTRNVGHTPAPSNAAFEPSVEQTAKEQLLCDRRTDDGEGDNDPEAKPVTRSGELVNGSLEVLDVFQEWSIGQGDKDLAD